MRRFSKEEIGRFLAVPGGVALFLALGLTGGDQQPSVAHAALNILNNRPAEHTLMQTIPPTPTEYAPTLAPTLTPTPLTAPTEVATLTPTPPTVPTEAATLTPTPPTAPTEAATLTPTPPTAPTEVATLAPTPGLPATEVATITPTPPTVPTEAATLTPTPGLPATEVATVTPTPGLPATEVATITPTSQEFTPTPTSTPLPIGYISGRALGANDIGIPHAQVIVQEPGGITVFNETNGSGEYPDHDVTQSGEAYTLTLNSVFDVSGNIIQELDSAQFVVEPQAGAQVSDLSISTENPLGSTLSVTIDTANPLTRAAAFTDGTVNATSEQELDGQLSAAIYTGNEVTRENYAGARVTDIDVAATLKLNQSFSDVEITGSDPDGVSIAFGEGTQTLTVTTAAMEPGVTYDVAAQVTQGEADIVQQNPDGSIEQSKGVDSDGNGTIDVTEQAPVSTDYRVHLPLVQK